MGYSRVRQMTLPSVTGTRTTLSSGAVKSDSLSMGYHRCEDVVGFKERDNPLFIEHRVRKVMVFSGQLKTWPVYRWDNYPMTNQPFVTSHLSVPGPIPSDVAASTQAAADTNPSRPDLDMPNFLGELLMLDWREIVTDLRDYLAQFVYPDHVFDAIQGRRKRRKQRQSPSNSVARHEFGYAQAIRDLMLLTDFAGQVDRRVQELDRLYHKGGLKRRRVVFSGENSTVSYAVPYQTVDAGIYGTRTVTTYVLKWVALRWVPDNPQLIPSAEDRVALAKRVVHGWSFDLASIGSTAWNLMPWSWLIDYIGNVGDYLDANRNSVGAHVGSCCVCTKTRTRRIDVITTISSGFRGTPGWAERVTLQRNVSAPSLTARLPFLTGKQLTVLSGIAANRKAGRGTKLG